MRCQYEMFGDTRFERLAGLSNGHVYALRLNRHERRAPREGLIHHRDRGVQYLSLHYTERLVTYLPIAGRRHGNKKNRASGLRICQGAYPR